MRINLKVPFAQKDAAKELGARWDAARKIWYVVDPEAIEVFSDWLPEVDTPGTTQPAAGSRSLGAAGVKTGPGTFKPMCDCGVLPWDHCPHTLAA
jgi:hypothetical protein